jgi:pimeloyl-ACP methyl ester carboxylesterase
MADSTSGAPPVRDKPKKQAVVLIHGIGEQRPMETLWQLVHTVWTSVPREDGRSRAVYSEPDEISGIFELRRLSTNENMHGKRTDFFEYYWAHLMHGNRFGHVVAWLGRLALRKREQVPPSLVKPWRVLQLPLIVGAALSIMLMGTLVQALLVPGMRAPFYAMATFIAVLWITLLLAEKLFLTPVLGDAARYLSKDPGDIQRRQDIRAKGLALLDDLHKSGKYDRIILVGHSLGGLIGYDLLTHLWARCNRRMDREGPIQQALEQSERAAVALIERPDDPAARAAWRLAQRRFFDTLRDAPVGENDPLWLISDFVTLGAPLAHAQTLLAETLQEFEAALKRRELATSPPHFEEFAGGRKRFSYCRQYGLADNADAGPRAPHNAAVFAAVCWTNIYFPSQGVLRGDLVGGSASNVFGPGVRDIPARAPTYGGWTPHLQYFETKADPRPWGDPTWMDHRQAIREGMALEDGEACWPEAFRAR